MTTNSKAEGMDGGFQKVGVGCWSRQAVGHMLSGPDGFLYWSEPLNFKAPGLRARRPRPPATRVIDLPHCCDFAFSPEGDLAIYSSNGPLEVHRGGNISRIQGAFWGASTFTPKGQLVVANRGELEVREGPEWKVRQSLGKVSLLRFLAADDSERLVLQGEHALSVLSMSDGSMLSRVVGFRGGLALSPDRSELVGSVGFELFRWKVGAEPQELNRPGIEPGITCLDWVEGLIVSGDCNGWIRLYCDRTMRLLGQWRSVPELRAVRWFCGGVAAAAESFDGRTGQLNFYSLRRVPQLPAAPPPARKPWRLRQPQEPLLLTERDSASPGCLSRAHWAEAVDAHTVLVTHRKTGRQRRLELDHEVRDLSSSADGNMLCLLTEKEGRRCSSFFWRGKRLELGLGWPGVRWIPGRVLLDHSSTASLVQTGSDWSVLQSWRAAPVKRSGLEGDTWVDRAPAHLAARISGDGTKVAIHSGCQDNFTLWESETGRSLIRFTLDLWSFELSCRGDFIVTEYSDRLDVLDARDGKRVVSGPVLRNIRCSPVANLLVGEQKDPPYELEVRALPGLEPLGRLPVRGRYWFNDAGELLVVDKQRYQIWSLSQF